MRPILRLSGSVLLSTLLLHSNSSLAQQVTGQDLDTILERADKLLEEAKVSYEGARTNSSVQSFVEAGFKLEDARIKYIVLQEIGSAEKQKIAADRLRAVNQLGKLIHDGKVAISGVPGERPSPKPAEPNQPPLPGEPAPAPPAPLRKVSVDVSKRAPVPEPAKQRDAEKLIKDLFKDQYAKKGTSDRKALARVLLGEVSKNRNDLAAVWVLCREAQDQAIQGGDLPGAMSAIDATAEIFDVDGMSMRNAALAAAVKTVKTPEECSGLVTASFRVIDELVANDQYDAADKLAASMLPMAKKAGNVLVYTQMTSRAKDVADAKGLYQGMKTVLETLAKTPDDPAANAEMGKFLCFVKGNWDLGLRFAVKGSDPNLKSLAERELANPPAAMDLAGIGDSWRELADREKSPLRKNQMLAHVRLLYESALPGTTGLRRMQMEKYLQADAEARPNSGATPGLLKGVNLLAMIDLKEDTVSGVWRIEGGALISPLENAARIQLPYLPPEEYDLLLEIEYLKGDRSLIIGLTWGASQCNIISDGWAGDITGLELLDGKSANMNETTFKGQLFPASKVCEVVCSIRKDHMTYTVDGTKVIEWKGNPKRLAVWKNFQVNRKDVLFLGVNPGSYRFRKITLVEVSGKGRMIR